MKDWTVNDFKDFVDRQNWTYARTYAENSPHSYVLKQKVNGTVDDLVSAASFIRKNGFPLLYWRKQYMVFYLEGHFYWTMDPYVEFTSIINRNNVEDYDIKIFAKKRK